MYQRSQTFTPGGENGRMIWWKKEPWIWRNRFRSKKVILFLWQKCLSFQRLKFSIKVASFGFAWTGCWKSTSNLQKFLTSCRHCCCCCWCRRRRENSYQQQQQLNNISFHLRYFLDSGWAIFLQQPKPLRQQQVKIDLIVAFVHSHRWRDVVGVVSDLNHGWGL